MIFTAVVDEFYKCVQQIVLTYLNIAQLYVTNKTDELLTITSSYVYLWHGTTAYLRRYILALNKRHRVVLRSVHMSLFFNITR